MDNNKINVSDHAIANIVKMTVKEIDGVVRLCDKHEKNILTLFKNKKTESVHLLHKNNNDDIEIEIEIVAKYGVSIQNLALKIQEKVSSALKNMLDIDTSSVNITVQSVE